MQKAIVFLYISDKQFEVDVTNIAPKHLQQKQKHDKFRDKFDKNVQDLYTENYKTLLGGTKEINGETYHVHGFEDSVLLRSQLLPN